jgi:polar amino acid transport system substrate-binding protein
MPKTTLLSRNFAAKCRNFALNNAKRLQKLNFLSHTAGIQDGTSVAMTFRTLFVFSFLLPFCCSLAAAPERAAPQMRVVTILNIAPDHPVVLLMQQAYQQLGMQMVMSHMAADRAMLELKKGVLVDATLAAMSKFESLDPELVRVPVAVYQLDLALFTSDPQIQSADWQSLQRHQVIYVQGMQSVLLTLQQYQIRRTETVLSLEQALKRLDLGRGSYAVLPKFEAEAMLKKLNLTKVRQLAPMLARIKLYHYVHKKHRALVVPLSEVLARLTGQAIEETKIGVNLPQQPQ